MIPYVHSNYERKENDDYQTIDPRCVKSLLDTFPFPTEWNYVDVCASHGSSIVNDLQKHGLNATGLPDAFADLSSYDVVVTNPPYARNIVDKIVNHVLSYVEQGRLAAAFFLMRANWDFAASRARIFDLPQYQGQVRMRFRPWWSEERKAQPIHNYVWRCWGASTCAKPVIYYQPSVKRKSLSPE